MYLAVLAVILANLAFGLRFGKGKVADWPQTLAASWRQDNDNLKAGPLREKADKYDVWNAKYHHPYYGGQVSVRFKDRSYSEIVDYGGTGDSCIWTGTYLGSQAMRYMVTRDPAARINIIKNVHALDGHLHITNTTGYIGRYWGSQHSLTYKGDEWCRTKPDCHIVNKGKYAGDYWEGGTTKDQYTGWFFGMGLAYEALDPTQDADTKKLIRDDVIEVVDKLIKDGWVINNEQGEHHLISAGPRPTYVYQLSWLLIAYHLTGNPAYKREIESRLTWYSVWVNSLLKFTGYFNVYNQYYGNNLAHTTWYNLLRLGKVYIKADIHVKLQSLFAQSTHHLVNLTHNPWFNGIYMAQGDYTPHPNDPYKKELIQDLTDFKEAPKHSYYLPARDPKTYTLDQATSWVEYFPQLMELLSNVKLNFKPQANEAFPIKLQCFSGFMFQSNPHAILACGSDKDTAVEPGHDYLAAYWLAVFQGLIDKSM